MKLMIEHQNCGSSRVLSLIELLVTVGVIGLLITIMVPALLGAKRTARIAKCIGNLRQIGVGLTLYSIESRFPHAALFTPNAAKARPKLWSDSLAEYTGAASFTQLYKCPGSALRSEERQIEVFASTITAVVDYGYNSQGSAASLPLAEKLGLGLAADPMARTNPATATMDSVANPAEMIAVADSLSQAFVVHPSDSIFQAAAPHGRVVNQSYCDGHVERNAVKQLYSNRPEMRRLWNRDHHAHPETW